MRNLFHSLAALWLLGVSAEAATVNAATTSSTDVQSAINSASSGDTVVVPSGSSTWSTGVTVTGKALTIQGAGIGSTNITDNTSSGAWTITCTSTNFVRLTGFTVTASSTHTSNGLYNFQGGAGTTASVAFRLDHCRVLIGSAITRGVITETIYGLIDHCTFDNTAGSGSVQLLSIWGSQDGSDNGFTPWKRALTFGTENAVYIEDCAFTAANQDESIQDAYGGARYVFRYNTVNNGEVGGGHGTDSGERRSTHSFEIYNNTYINNSATRIRGGTVRGGTGVFYNNTYGGTGGAWYPITLMYYRACPGLDQSHWGSCDGTIWRLDSATSPNVCSTGGGYAFDATDKETLGAYGGSFTRGFDGTGTGGYPGRDQPGFTTGQVSEPIYMWSNGSMTMDIYDGGTSPSPALSNYILSGREYIDNGSTPKPGYTSYTYPHPLQGVASTIGGRPVKAGRSVRRL